VTPMIACRPFDFRGVATPAVRMWNPIDGIPGLGGAVVVQAVGGYDLDRR
jgi:hypothetical protein